MKRIGILCLLVWLFSSSSYATVYSGNCGYNNCDSLQWTLDTETGTLDIFCKYPDYNARMGNYYSYSYPWYSNRNYIKNVNISGVSSIGNYAFCNCTGLTSVTIPNSVTSIGSSAFSGCSSLTSINIPNSVTNIGSFAFSDCSGLTQAEFVSIESLCKITFNSSESNPLYNARHLYINGQEITDVVIPNNVTSIGDYSFIGCSGLTSVTIPNSVTSIGSNTFQGCSGLTSITIPNRVTSIGQNAFNDCSNLTSISINSNALVNKTTITNSYLKSIFGSQVKEYILGSSVTSIGNYAFYNCAGLTSVTIPNSVTSIGYSAFFGCSSLTSVTINSNTIVSTAYSTSSNLVSIFGSQVEEYILGDEITSIGSYAFYNCSGITSITIPSNVTSIGNSAFSGCSSLKSMTIPSSVTSIGDNAFIDCSSMTKAEFASIESLCRIKFNNYCSNPLFYAKHLYINGKEVTDLIIPDNVTSIGSSAFYNCSSLTSITIPNSVTSIGEFAFCGCSGLTSVTIAESVTIIGWAAFNGCSSLTKAEFASIESLCSITFYMEYSNPLYYAKHLYINGQEVTDLVIPSSVTNIGNRTFMGCSGLTSIVVDKDNTYYDSRDNCNAIIETSSNTLIIGCKSTVIPNSVTSIGSSAFENCSGLTSVTIPNSVTSIGNNVFQGCSGLTSVTIPESVTSIGSSAFENCSGLTSVTIPNSVTSIGNNVFQGCSGLTSVTIPESVTSISSSTFSGCTGLTSVTIPNSVTSIGSDAFSDCSSLTSVTIPNSVTSIGSSAFYRCTGLTSITIPNSVKSIGNYAFDDCSGLASITIPESVKSIGSYAFRNCSGLTSVTIGSGVTSIRYYAFYNCSSLTSITIPESVTSIDDYAFGDCPNLKEVYCLAEQVPSTNSNAFYNTNIASATLYVPESAVDNYKISTPWSGFGTILGGDVEPEYILGDANGNGEVEIGDITSVLTLMATPEATGYDKKAADANGNGEIEIGDVTTILTIMAGE